MAKGVGRKISREGPMEKRPKIPKNSTIKTFPGGEGRGNKKKRLKIALLSLYLL